MASEIAAIQGSASVVSAIKRASQSTGAGFDHLMKVAARESSLNPEAKAGTSSAAGLFQFIEQTWLGAVKKYGDRHGLESYAADINRDASGKFQVADGNRKEAILNLRFDAGISASMAGELTKENGNYLSNKIGRDASSTDLYLAHFLGPAGAVKMLSAAANTKAADILPAAARANHNVFYDGARAKTVAEVIGSVADSMGVQLGDAKPIDAKFAEAPTMNAQFSHNRFAAFVGKALSQENSAPTILRSTFANTGENPLSPGAFIRAEETAASPLTVRSKFAAIAYSVLQALDLTRVGSDRNDPTSQQR